MYVCILLFFIYSLKLSSHPVLEDLLRVCPCELTSSGLIIHVLFVGLELLWLLLYISHAVHPEVGQGQHISGVFIDR